KKAKKIMCCAESARSEISKFMDVPIEKITNVSSAVESFFKPLPKKSVELKEKLGIDGPILFYVGRIAFYKGVDDIIQAYNIAKKKIPDLNLIIGGKPTFKMIDEVEKWKKENPGIFFTGMIPDEEMPIYYSMANIFITYSYASEGFGLTPIESLNCETPVICSSLPAYKEVLQDFGTFIEPRKPELLVKEIINHLDNPDPIHEKVKSAKNFLKQYTWKEVAKRVESVYLQYIEEKER
ncbi:MAG: glycosyltransferase family 4 protein, partial [archaeon]|nr:glycosyltransferase family 4 protein [archaeon]